MTLIVAACNYWNVVQVSDRRLTLNGKPWDDNANKCVIVGCRDAIMSVTYTGPAYIGPLPTDEWIVHVIDANNGQHRDMGYVVDLLTRAATAAFASELPDSDRGSSLTMVVAGWHWKGHRLQAYTWWIANCDVTSPYLPSVDTFVKGWFRSRRTARPGEGKGAFAAGATAALDSESWDGLLQIIEGETDPNILVSAMVDVVRQSAHHGKYGQFIGKDCLAVVLPRPGHGTVYSEYWPEMRATLSFTPAIITPNFRAVSLEMLGGGLTLTAGGKAFEFRGSQVQPSGRVVWGFRTQPPRPRPD